MSVEQIGGPPPPASLADVERPTETAPVGDPSPPAPSSQPRLPADAVADVPVATIEALLLAVARGNQHAFVALQSRMAGLAHLDGHRVRHDDAGSGSVTRETFADDADIPYADPRTPMSHP